MTKLQAIATAKQFRKDADELLQRMKAHRKDLCLVSNANYTQAERLVGAAFPADVADNLSEVIAQHVLSLRDLESCIMRQGMALKYIGNPEPYPESKNPASHIVHPTADGLSL